MLLTVSFIFIAALLLYGGSYALRKKKDRDDHLALAAAYNKLVMRTRIIADYELAGLRVIALDAKRKTLVFIDHCRRPHVQYMVDLGAQREVLLEESSPAGVKGQLHLLVQEGEGGSLYRFCFFDGRKEPAALWEKRVEMARRWQQKLSQVAPLHYTG